MGILVSSPKTTFMPAIDLAQGKTWETTPGSYGETPKKTSKDVQAIVTTGGYDLYKDDLNIALAASSSWERI